jgi:hypothetical protein
MMKKLLLLFTVVLFLASGAFAQDWQLDPAYGDLELDEYFDPDPYIISILAGGSVDLSRSRVSGLPRSVTGFVANAPDLDFYYETSGRMDLTIRVRGFGEDTVLLVNDPDGRWFFNDDHDGSFEDGGWLDPSITFIRPISGLYSIWVGTFSNTDFVEVDLEITELQ